MKSSLSDLMWKYMQNSQMNRVIKLVRRTGDKVVLMDNESDAVMMLMDLGAYEKMLSSAPERVETLTEEELMEKINRDVAVWRAYNDKERLDTIDKVLEKTQLHPDAARPAPHQTMPSTAGIMPVEKAKQSDYLSSKDNSTSVGTEESAADIVAEEDEEKFYLEPVE